MFGATGFRVFRRDLTEDGGKFEPYPMDVWAQNYDESGLKTGGRYKFKIEARKRPIAECAVRGGRRDARTLPAVTNVEADADGDFKVTMTWDRSPTLTAMQSSSQPATPVNVHPAAAHSPTTTTSLCSSISEARHPGHRHHYAATNARITRSSRCATEDTASGPVRKKLQRQTPTLT